MVCQPPQLERGGVDLPSAQETWGAALWHPCQLRRPSPWHRWSCALYQDSCWPGVGPPECHGGCSHLWAAVVQREAACQLAGYHRCVQLSVLVQKLGVLMQQLSVLLCQLGWRMMQQLAVLMQQKGVLPGQLGVL